MQAALDRISKNLTAYANGQASRAMLAIELVSAFKVACRQNNGAPADLDFSIQIYVESVISRIDSGELSEASATDELHRLYQAAYANDPEVFAFIAGHTTS